MARPSMPARPSRNPFVAAARLRGGAGRHQATAGSQRQRARQALRAELRAQHPPSP